MLIVGVAKNVTASWAISVGLPTLIDADPNIVLWWRLRSATTSAEEQTTEPTDPDQEGRYKVRRELKTALMVIGWLSVAGNLAEATEKYPASWKKTMVNDASTNPYIKKYSAPLSDPKATAIRNVMLAQAVGKLCLSSKPNGKKIKSYVEENGMSNSRRGELKQSAFLAESEFRMFDYRALAHICAASDLLFGKSGLLIADAVKAGRGEPKLRYDPNNPYIRLPGFLE